LHFVLEASVGHFFFRGGGWSNKLRNFNCLRIYRTGIWMKIEISSLTLTTTKQNINTITHKYKS